MPPRKVPPSIGREHLFSPTKPSPLGKRARPSTPSKSVNRTTTTRSPTKRASVGASPTKQRRQISRDEEDDVEEGEEDEIDESDYDSEEEEIQAAAANKSETFVSRSAGDGYLIQASTAPKTSDSLLSTALDPAFTFSTYQSALQTFDSSTQPSLVATRERVAARVASYARHHPKWAYQLDQGFNLAFYGFGSKKAALDQFGEYLRGRGTVVVANGYDPAVAVADVVTALEESLTQAEEAEALKAGVVKSRKRGRAPATPRGKAKAKAGSAPSSPAGATPTKAAVVAAPPTTQVSALEGRVRRFCAALRAAPKSIPHFYLVVHNLDSPSLRPPKMLTLLALLAAQPRIHLATSTDHLRAASILPTALATARPPPETDDKSDAATRYDARAFTFLHVELSTLQPYSLEVFHSGALSNLFPPTIYPPMSSSLDPSSASLLLSTTHVLLSVTSRSRKLFRQLAQQQLDAFAALPPNVSRALLLTPKGQYVAAPLVAVKLDLFKAQAVDLVLASTAEQVDALLAEFRDHSVVRGSKIGPAVEGAEGEGAVEGVAAGGGAEWIWIPLGKEALQEVIDEIED